MRPAFPGSLKPRATPSCAISHCYGAQVTGSCNAVLLPGSAAATKPVSGTTTAPQLGIGATPESGAIAGVRQYER
jgi:hypothetical protein